MKLTKEQQQQVAELFDSACRATTPVDSSAMVLRAAGGGSITTELRDQLLAKCAAGEYVEIEVDLLAYEQRAGEHNRNFVRFADGALTALGKSGKSTPFLRDHNQHDSLSKAGKVLASATEKRAAGDYAINQTARLTAPWAVDLALRDLLSAVSIGWRPTGPVLCSACGVQVFTKCWHVPGERLREREDEDGRKRKVHAPDGDIVVEWVFTKGELVETSFVPIGGVPNAKFDSIRAALSAHVPEFRAALAPDGEDLAEENPMKHHAALVATLSLAATASEDEVPAAVSAVVRERDTLRSELGIANADVARLSAIVETHQAAEKKTAEDEFVRAAIATGRITLADEPAWRDLYQLDAARATKRMGERKAQSATPVGAPLASAAPVPAADPTVAPSAQRDQVNSGLAARGMDPAAVLHYAKAFGASKPIETIAGALGTGTGA